MRKYRFLLFFVGLPAVIQAQNIFPASGNVGIGTTTPISILDITTNNPSLYLRNIGGAASIIRLIPYMDGKTYFETGSSTDSDSRADINFTSMNGVTNFMIIQGSTGNIGIGTKNPTSKLSVNGEVSAKKVKVTQAGWPDYVFDTAYSLSSLEKTAAYIQANKHLPDIPSAKEIRNEGLDLGDMQKKQMRKIEELTIYMIAMHKKQQQQDETIKKLQLENQQLYNQLKNSRK